MDRLLLPRLLCPIIKYLQKAIVQSGISTFLFLPKRRKKGISEFSLKSYFNLTSKYELIKWKKSSGDVLLISCPTKHREKNIEINRSAFDMLKMMDGEKSLAEIGKLLAKEYSEQASELPKTVKAFAQKMVSMGVVEVYETPGMRKRETVVVESDHWLKKLQIEITPKCNLKCKHCYFYENESKNKMSEMPIGKIEEIIDEAKRLGVEAIFLTGGEAFLRKDIFDIVAYIAGRNFTTMIISNGTLINPETAARLSAFKNIHVTISLDGAKEAHENLRGVSGCFEEALDGIRNLTAVGLRPVINFTISRCNLSRSQEILPVLKELGYKKPPLLGFAVNMGRAAKSNVSVTVKEFEEEFTRYWEAMKELFKLEKYPVENICGNNCGVGENSLVITAEGNIIPCPLLNREPFILGNVCCGNLSSIWYNSRRLHRIRSIDMKRNRKCGSCKRWEYCKGGCREFAMTSTATSKNGFFNSPDPFACARLKALENCLEIVEEDSDEFFMSHLV
jgi:radical SAM protein with 4Fe4S-binding SPASM domain